MQRKPVATAPFDVLKSFNMFAAGKSRLPTKIFCPVCGEVMLNLTLKPDEMAGAIASGALAAKKLSCMCGVQGVFALRRTPDGLHLYSLTFWILPKTAEKQGTLTTEELKRWLMKPPAPGPVA